MVPRTRSPWRWPVTVLAAAGPLVVLWRVGGAPWWPPAAALAAGLLVRLLGRILPRRLHHPIAAGGVVGAVAAVRVRVLLMMAAVLAVVGTGGLVVEHLHAQQRRAAQWAQASEFNRAQLLPNTPGRAARTLLRGIADDDPIICTTLLAPAAGAQLAATVGATDCAGAVLSSVSQIIRRILALLAVHRGPTASSRAMRRKIVCGAVRGANCGSTE